MLMVSLIYLARRIVIPIKELSLMTASVTRGNLDQKLETPFSSSDEVGDLWDSFRKMQQGLKETIAWYREFFSGR